MSRPRLQVLVVLLVLGLGLGLWAVLRLNGASNHIAMVPLWPSVGFVIGFAAARIRANGEK